MSDNLRRYRAIRDALTQCYPGQPSGTVARHLITLAALISGIVGSKSTQLPQFCLRAGRGVDGMIGHTQPRRIAARTIADRIAESRGQQAGPREAQR